MRRIFIDCTHEYYFGGNTGIQRVVRNLVNNLDVIRDVECVPVVWCINKYVLVKKISGKKERIRNLLALIARIKNRKNKKNGTKGENIERHIIPGKNLRKFARKAAIFLISLQCFFKPRMRPTEGDVFLFPYFGSMLMLDNIKYLLSKKMKIGFIAFDLLPIRYPKFFVRGQAEDFEEIFIQMYKSCSFIMSISETTKQDVEAFAKEKGLPAITIGAFNLGHDMDISTGEKVRSEIKAILETKKPYIAVSTIEPRKNHAFILSEFERMWDKGSRESLAFIGKVGWLTDDFIQRVISHKLYGDRLFMWNDINDTELDIAYKNTKALITASIDEGSNLPLLEALSRGASVYASDIKIHREVGANYVNYFDLKPGKLCDVLTNTNTRVTKKYDLKLPSWKDSTIELITKINALVQ